MQRSSVALYGQIKTENPLELEPIIVEIANSKRTQGEPLTMSSDKFNTL